VTVLDQLEQITAEEHAALVRGDWRSLESCVEQKQILSDQLGVDGLGQGAAVQARRLSVATRYNLELASRLSRQLSEIWSSRDRRPTYNQRGRLGPKPLAVMSFTC
jgi:flagellar biosynthesis/type III secretory pathway chaperone